MQRGELPEPLQSLQLEQLVGRQVEPLQGGELDARRAGEGVAVEIQRLQGGQVLGSQTLQFTDTIACNNQYQGM